jgi:diguanylate cyclase (GGDEF)-like protein
VPLIANGRAVGVISMQSYTSNAYDQEEIRLLELVATQAAFAIQNSRLFEKAQHEISSRIEAEESLRAANNQLELQIREISDLRDQLREQAIRDPLTGLFNRRYLTETLTRELDQARRAGAPVSIIIMDIDWFKNVNDTFGHDGGDKMLNALATLLQAHCRSGDIACRYGGEEFVVVLIGTALEIASQRAEELRMAFHALVIPHESGNIRATLSLGAAAFPLHGETGESVLIKADQALYQAKQTGRNRVVVAP